MWQHDIVGVDTTSGMCIDVLGALSDAPDVSQSSAMAAGLMCPTHPISQVVVPFTQRFIWIFHAFDSMHWAWKWPQMLWDRLCCRISVGVSMNVLPQTLHQCSLRIPSACALFLSRAS